jgi:hypothetical protein
MILHCGGSFLSFLPCFCMVHLTSPHLSRRCAFPPGENTEQFLSDLVMMHTTRFIKSVWGRAVSDKIVLVLYRFISNAN